jgi:general secretion pathway protein E
MMDDDSSAQPVSDEQFLQQGLLGGADHARALAEKLGLPLYMEGITPSLSADIYKKVPYAFAKRHVVLPFSQDSGAILVAMSDPLNLEALEDLRLLLSCPITPVYAPTETILNGINECYNHAIGAASHLIADMDGRLDEDKNDSSIEVYDLLDQGSSQAPIVKLLNLILTEAIQQGASDLHFEPFEDRMRVRYRIDGVLQNRHAPATEYQTQLITRIKVMSRMDIAEHRLPQDGRIKLKMGRREIDFRVSTVPVAGGERMVLRILDKGNVSFGLDNVGMLPLMLEQFRSIVRRPEGIILVTGPTGSGKTTTLYSTISELYNDETNIMTIEDPVEYNLKGIAQIGVQPKIRLDFAAGLRHILRQDPDIIMIGEIRDRETAEIAIQAALTGHLVLSTLHTNDAPSAIARLVDMGIEPYLLSSSLVGVFAQRLVRRICPACKAPYNPLDKELQSLGLSRNQLDQGCLYHGTGCPACYGTGYKGRHGIYELMQINSSVKQQIIKSPDAVELRRLALQHGMISLLDHGAYLTQNGITTVAEVLRATRGIDE